MSRCGLGAQAALLATLTLVACGGGEESDANGGISVSDVEDAGLDFARCMRERGTMEACSERGPGLRLAE